MKRHVRHRDRPTLFVGPVDVGFSGFKHFIADQTFRVAHEAVDVRFLSPFGRLDEHFEGGRDDPFPGSQEAEDEYVGVFGAKGAVHFV